MKSFCRLILLITALFSTAFAAEPLPADQAFQFSASAKNYQTILVNFQIAPGYYLYQQHFSFRIIKPAGVTLGNPLYPAGTQKLNTTLGVFNVYANTVTIPLPIIDATQPNVVLQARYQGCSKAGYCYPPTTKTTLINLSGNYLQPASTLNNLDIAPIMATPEIKKPDAPTNPIAALLSNHSIFIAVLGFFGFGILLSFTPCVLPMIPILSSMILGKEKMSHTHAFFISLFYVLGMSITYAIAGVLFGMIGGSIQVIFQKPWIIALFSLLFVVMALSLFGLFHLELPEKLRSRISNVSQHQKRGSYIGALIMGVLSTLILSPCVTPPLVAALGYISQTGSAVVGGIALFAMGIGMGAPLLLIGALGPKVLPKSGEWMNTIKNGLGILLLAIAILMLERILPAIVGILLWAALAIGTGLFLGALTTAISKSALVKKIIGILLFIYGILLAASAYHGNTHPLDILHRESTATAPALSFKPVTSLSDINSALQNAAANNQVLLLDFYANWCLACKELDAMTLQNKTVQAELSHFVLLRADITQNTPDDQAIMKQYGVVAPPTLLFFKDNQEIPNTRIIGYLSPKKFLKQLKIAQH